MCGGLGESVGDKKTRSRRVGCRVGDKKPTGGGFYRYTSYQT